MKRKCLMLLVMVLLFTTEVAYAAKARSIVTDFDSQYHAEHLMVHIGESCCHATGNYIKMRNSENKVIGHLEQADEILLINIQDGKAHILVLSSHKTSPDSWDGMMGWVNSDYVDCTCDVMDYYTLHDLNWESSSQWKAAYLAYLQNEDVFWAEECQYWLVHIDDDDIPELIIDTQTTAGGCLAVSYGEGTLREACIGSSGSCSYVDRMNILWYSGGHQGQYYDTVYSLDDKGWLTVYYSEHIDFYPLNASSEQDIVRTYYVDGLPVSHEEYYSSLCNYVSIDESTRLKAGMNFSDLYLLLEGE